MEADATKPFPTVLELVRQSGATFRVEVEYPWLPPTCSHCKELGQILKDCLEIKRQWVPVNKKKGTREASTNSDQVVVTIHEPNSSATTPIEEPVDVSPESQPPPLPFAPLKTACRY